MGVVLPSSSLSSLLSQALVAHTIEIDNEAEHRLPHRITRQNGGSGHDGPWLVSFALWANVLQYLDGDEPCTVANLRARARTDQLLLNGLRRWGYISLTAPAGHALKNPPQDEATVRARKGGRRAMEVWSILPALIDAQWRGRLGAPIVNRLEHALRTIFGALTVDPPAYLPVVHPAQGGKAAPAPQQDGLGEASARLPREGTLSALLSGVLHAFTSRRKRTRGRRGPSVPTRCACSPTRGRGSGICPG
jgi:hypothetical protein